MTDDHQATVSYQPALRAVRAALERLAVRPRRRFDPDGCGYCGQACGELALCATCDALLLRLRGRTVADGPARRVLTFVPLADVVVPVVAPVREWRPYRDDDDAPDIVLVRDEEEEPCR